MDFQNIIVGLIIFAALIYVGLMVWKKAKSFKPTNATCSNDCGCEAKTRKNQS